MKTTYSDLLQRPEWKEKTKVILNRDDHTCQRCGTGKNDKLNTTKRKANFTGYLKFISVPGKTADFRKIRMKISPDNPGIPIKTSFTIDELNEHKNLCLIINFVINDKIQYPFNGTLGINNFDQIINELVDEDPFLTYMRRKLLSPVVDIDLEGIYVEDMTKSPNYIFAKNHSVLHVHHKCYRKGIEIWEHSDDEYVTLCNICHGIVHENQEVPFFDIHGNILQNLEKCSRCLGKGFLKEYSYVQNGVCFKCSGRGVIFEKHV